MHPRSVSGWVWCSSDARRTRGTCLGLELLAMIPCCCPTRLKATDAAVLITVLCWPDGWPHGADRVWQACNDASQRALGQAWRGGGLASAARQALHRSLTQGHTPELHLYPHAACQEQLVVAQFPRQFGSGIRLSLKARMLTEVGFRNEAIARSIKAARKHCSVALPS